jgi:hypothetical protein
MIRRGRPSASGDASVSIVGDSNAPVTTTSINTQVLGMSLVPLTAAAKDPRPVFRAAGIDTFTGREWLTNAVDRFFVENPCGYVFVEAEAGLGKTAFAAWLVKTRGYLSHFSRYSGGGTVQVALANLSAQLITSFDLNDQAPGGMLPEWAQSPAGFESLLAAAAERARERRRPVVLVVDGLDEADAPAEGLPLGLPLLLPDGVYVVGTYRTGRSPRRPDAPEKTMRIAKDDQRNRGDICEYLTKAVGEAVLAARLAETGMDHAEFIDLLAKRCDGVWVYLRYVLNELRFGLRRPHEVNDLPSGLRNYYADQIRRWQHDPAWHTALLPLVSTLGVVGDALPAVSLARLAGNIDPVAVQRWCDLTIRSLLTTTGTPLRYEIYHNSFREFLNADHDDPSTWPGDQRPYELLALNDQLRQAALSAHNRISDAYLTCFGGLEAGLPVLAEDPSAADVDGGYPLRHLARHLCHAGRAGDLHALLAVERPASENHVVNTWFAAHDRAESIISYLDDLARARRDSAIATDRVLVCHQPAATLGMEIRYALMAASIASLTDNVSADLLGQLIHAGVWSPQRGLLDHARRIVDPSKRFEALLTISSQVNPEEHSVVMAQALKTATAITDDYSRSQALARVAPHLPPELLPQALAAATAVTDHHSRFRALAGLAPHLPSDLLAQALAAATAIPDDLSRAQALAALAPRLPSDLLAQALATASAILDDYSRVLAFAGFVPYLAGDERATVIAQALAAATTITEDRNRIPALAELARYLPSDLLAQALEAASAITDDSWRAEALAGLAAHVAADERPTFVAQALAAAAAHTDNHSLTRARALARLAPHLPSDLLPQALEAATGITDEFFRGQVLAVLAPYLPSDLLAQALEAAIAIPNDFFRADALRRMAPHLPSDLLAQALQAAIAIPSDFAQGWALPRMAPHLPSDLLAQALAAAAAIPSSFSRAEALAGLAPYLPSDLLAQALVAAAAIPRDFDRAKALAGLAPHLAADERPAVMAQALAAATAIIDDFALAKALAGLVPHLAADERPTFVIKALAAAAAITDDHSRAEALAGLAPHLPSDLLAQALAAATAITDDSSRAKALAGLAPHLDAEERPAVIARALAAATDIPSDVDRAKVLAGLTPHLAADERSAVVAQALAAATAVTGDISRADALASVAPHLPSDLLGQALAAATVGSDYTRAHALAGLAPYLPSDLLAQALEAATTISRDFDRARALAGLAPHLAADERPTVMAQALAAATAVTDDHSRSGALARVAPHLPFDLLAQALAAATAITDDSSRAHALAGLAPYLPSDLLAQALAAVTAIIDDSRADALAGLAPYLPSDLLAQALDAATVVTDDSSRAYALARLAPHLPSDLLAQALDGTPRERPETLTAILARGRAVLRRDGDVAHVNLLRNSLNGTNRRDCLNIITAVAPTIAEIGGARSIEQCVNAVLDVYRWWP